MTELDRRQTDDQVAHARGARGVVLLTGGTSGIGLASVLALADAGYHVVTTGLPGEGESLLQKAPRGSVSLLSLDLSDPAQIAATANDTRALIEAAGVRGLTALVNNAGIAVPGPLETIETSVLRKQFEINLFGQLALTQAVLPLLREAHGRIVNIGSVAGWIAMPFLGVLAASKAAFRSMNDALRLELRPSGVGVVLLEPGRVASAAPGKLLQDCDVVIGRMSADERARYAEGLTTMITRFVKRAATGNPPESVARAVVASVTSAKPPTRRPLGSTSRRLGLFARFLPNPCLDRLRYRLLGLSAFARGAAPREVGRG